jgi:hypothetical protein
LDSGAPAPISRGNRKFESISLQQRVDCEPDSLDQGGEIASLLDSLPLDWAGARNNLGNALAALPLSRRLGGATGSLIAACTSCAAESTVRLRSNCSEI